MKIALVMVLAAYYDWLPLKKTSRPFWVFVPVVLILIPVALVLKQPDLGTSILLITAGALVMFLAGVHWGYFAVVIAAVVGLVTAVFQSRGTTWQLLKDYQFRRIDTFLDPSSDPLGAGYHITQSKISLGSGGWTGRGFMQGTQSRLNFLPEKHTDFIFTTLAEEFGFRRRILAFVALRVDHFLLHHHGAFEPGSLFVAANPWNCRDFLPVLRGQHVDGHGPGTGGGRAAAAGQLWRISHVNSAGAGLWPDPKRAYPQTKVI